MSRMNVTTDDLYIAATWLDTYEPSEDHDETAKALYRVADWLRHEAERRVEDKDIRTIQRVGREQGLTITRSKAREMAANIRAQQATDD